MTGRINRRDLLASSSVLAGASLAGCSRVSEWATCRDPELVEESSRPANLVTVEGVGGSFGDDPEALVHDAELDDPGEDDRFPTYVERVDEERVDLLVPVHPGDLMGGGTLAVELVSEDGEVNCGGLELEVEPLEPAPGATGGMIDDLEDGLRRNAEASGLDPDTLLEAEVMDLDPWHRGIAAALQMIDGPEFSNNLRAIARGEAPILDEYAAPDEEAVEVVDAVVAEAGVVEGVAEVSELLAAHAVGPREEYTLPSPGVSRGGVPSGGGRAHAVESGPDARASQDGGGRELPDHFVSPEQLDDMMGTQAWFADANSGATREIRDFTGLALGSVSVATGVTGFVPLSAAAGMSAAAVSVMQIAYDLYEHTLPSSLEDVEIDAAPTEYNEDAGEPRRGEWSATLQASSQEWTLDYPTLAGLVPGVGDAAKFLANSKLLAAVGDDFAEFLVGHFQTYMTKVWDVEDDDDAGPVTLDPETWGVWVDPRREDEGVYFAWEVNTRESEDGTAPFSLVRTDEGDERAYDPQGVGVSELRVRTRDGRFGDQFRESVEVLQVKAIQVEIESRPVEGVVLTPGPPFHAAPGGVVNLYASVENANDASVEWEVVGDGHLVAGGDGNVADYEAPDDGSIDDETTVLLVAESAADGWLRADGEPTRSDTARVVVSEGLTVAPEPVCLSPDETHAFTAAVGGETVSFDDLDWTIRGPGSLGSDGVFDPVGNGEVTIEFEYDGEGDRTFTDSVSFEVAEFCGRISVVSSKFSHTSRCVGHSFHTPWDIRTPFAEKAFVGMGIPLPLKRRLEEEGERKIETDEFGVMVRDNDQSMSWYAGAPDADDPPPSSLTIEREEREVDGEVVPVYSGQFSLPMRPSKPLVAGVRHITVHGEFSGVLPEEHVDCLD